ncbi:MAG: nickel-dependent hydrogenase large subunit [Desulfobacterales bacterium]|jgi:[NiFe] hydrogenase large subunit|nr:nickel-dependent hydrogenase large subunit [Desulfobacterales bacterium]
MAKRITIDPITRIEGHLKIEVEVEGGKVTNAWSSGQMFRGIEMMLIGRDPRDAHHFVQRSCGVCTYVHAVASVRAVDDAVGVKIPQNARLIRNLLHGAQYQHDHLVHFYHLHALDWVDIISALKADPQKTATLADNVSNAQLGGVKHYRGVQQRLKTFVESGQLGPFNNAYWGHSAYKLPPEANLMAAAHYIEALKLQARTARLHAIFGGKNPHPQSLVVGGVTCVEALSPDRLAEFMFITEETQNFITNVYLPDLMAIAGFYKDWGAIGGCTNFLGWGDFPANEKEPESLYFPRGIIKNRNLGDVQMAKQEAVTEHIHRSWYEGNASLHPFAGETKPLQENPVYKPDDGKYSWIKAPRYENLSCEVGPLARVLIAYGKSHKEVKPLVDKVLTDLSIPAAALFSTLGRTAARAIETVVIGEAMKGWLNELIGNIKNGDTKIYEPYEMPAAGQGIGLNDVPRGALGHWVKIKDKKIENYQYVVPSTWNLGPRDASGQKSPVEEALIGTPIADPKQPLEVLRTVHSFDPCIACAVHVIDPKSNEVYKVRVV